MKYIRESSSSRRRTSFGILLSCSVLLMQQMHLARSFGFSLNSHNFYRIGTLNGNSCTNENYVWDKRVSNSPSKMQCSTRSLRLPTTRLSALDFNFGEMLYSAQSTTTSMANSSMGDLNPISLSILYLAGLFTSFSPCALGLLPLTVSYISTATGTREDKASFLPTMAYTAGLACVFVLFGLSVSLVGGIFGQSGTTDSSLFETLLIASLSSGVSIIMGLQLLGIISLPLPSIELEVASGVSTIEDGESLKNSMDEMKSLIATFLLGGSSALVASPCATPVLTSILAFVAANRDPLVGAVLLFVYTLGYSTPLVVVGATGGAALARLEQANSSIGKLVTPMTASVLIWFGTTSFLKALFGDPSYAGLVY